MSSRRLLGRILLATIVPLLLSLLVVETLLRAGAAIAARTRRAPEPLTGHFEELLARLPREALLVPDGHCNDRGYDEVAARVAAALERANVLR